MLLPRIRLSSGALLSPLRIRPSLTPSTSSSTHASPQPILGTTPRRPASHKAQGAATSKKDGPGKRLGAKKAGEEAVLPSQIIFRQRGTLWHAGTNAGVGRDHTIYALTRGFVKYYRDPARHPTRRYIGVVYERHHTLPQPPHAARRRRLGLVAAPREDSDAAKQEDLIAGDEGDGVTRPVGGELPVNRSISINAPATPSKRMLRDESRRRVAALRLRPGYMYREANWEIGRAAERVGVRVPKFRPGDRFAAWRKSAARKAKNAEKRGMRAKGGKSAKGK